MAEASNQSKECPIPVTCCTSNKIMRLLVDDATAFQLLRLGSGAVLVSNLFLSRSLIELAMRQAKIGCNEDDPDDCEVYGFRPSSLITLIGTVSGLIAAFLLPIAGAIVDYTKYRKLMGVIAATLLILIQAAQIYTVESTWLVMAVLQAINSFFYQLTLLAAYAYLPEIKDVVGEATMTTYSSRFYAFFFLIQVVFLLLVTVISYQLDNDDVPTAQVAQAIDVVVSGFFFVLAFYFFTNQPPKGKLGEGESLLLAGFKQVFKTSGGIFKHYPRTLGFFFLAVVFSEAAANSFTVVAVTFLVEYDFTATQTGIIFLLVLVSCIAGSFIASFLMKKVSPVRCMQLNFAVIIAVNFVAFLSIPKVKIMVYPSAVLWGIMLGWFYPTELQLYASLMPKGQDTELAGFFLYCSQVLTFLPPLVFTIMNENLIPLYWGGVTLNIYYFVGLCFYALMPDWKECVAITETENKMIQKRGDNEEGSSLVE